MHVNFTKLVKSTGASNVALQFHSFTGFSPSSVMKELAVPKPDLTKHFCITVDMMDFHAMQTNYNGILDDTLFYTFCKNIPIYSSHHHHHKTTPACNWSHLAVCTTDVRFTETHSSLSAAHLSISRSTIPFWQAISSQNRQSLNNLTVIRVVLQDL